MRPGETFLGALPDQTPHLWVVLTPPDDTGEVVIVNFTSDHFDTTCPIEVGEHPFVKHRTFVRYQDAVLTSAKLLQKGVSKGFLQPHKPLSPALLKRIREGAVISDFTPAKVVSAVKRALKP